MPRQPPKALREAAAKEKWEEKERARLATAAAYREAAQAEHAGSAKATTAAPVDKKAAKAAAAATAKAERAARKQRLEAARAAAAAVAVDSPPKPVLPGEAACDPPAEAVHDPPAEAVRDPPAEAASDPPAEAVRDAPPPPPPPAEATATLEWAAADTTAGVCRMLHDLFGHEPLRLAEHRARYADEGIEDDVLFVDDEYKFRLEDCVEMSGGDAVSGARTLAWLDVHLGRVKESAAPPPAPVAAATTPPSPPGTTAAPAPVTSNHSAMIPGLKPVVARLSKRAGITRITPGRLHELGGSAHGAPVLDLRLQREKGDVERTSYKLVARKGKTAQDVLVAVNPTLLSPEGLDEAIADALESRAAPSTRSTAPFADAPQNLGGIAARRAATSEVHGKLHSKHAAVTEIGKAKKRQAAEQHAEKQLRAAVSSRSGQSKVAVAAHAKRNSGLVLGDDPDVERGKNAFRAKAHKR